MSQLNDAGDAGEAAKSAQMDKVGVDGRLRAERRKWLIATTVLSCGGGAACMVPLVASLGPGARERASGGPRVVETSVLAPGVMTTVAWRGRPVWLLRRTAAMLRDVDRAAPQCADPQSLRSDAAHMPDYCRNPLRSRAEHPDIVVLIGLCTHLGCVPQPRLAAGAQPGLPDDWAGGWHCPCHGSMFDLAGRVLRNQPATRNLDIPRYHFASPARMIIGEDEHGEA